jgi:hypothetical protein
MNKNPGTRRVKKRARPVTPQTGADTAARITASGCRAGKPGLGEPLRLRIASLLRGLAGKGKRAHVNLRDALSPAAESALASR